MREENASSTSTDFDNEEFISKWFLECRKKVKPYLRQEKVHHGKIGREPAWFISPYVSLWAIESIDNPGSVGWWANVVMCQLTTSVQQAQKTLARQSTQLPRIGWNGHWTS